MGIGSEDRKDNKGDAAESRDQLKPLRDAETFGECGYGRRRLVRPGPILPSGEDAPIPWGAARLGSRAEHSFGLFRCFAPAIKALP